MSPETGYRHPFSGGMPTLERIGVILGGMGIGEASEGIPPRNSSLCMYTSTYLRHWLIAIVSVKCVASFSSCSQFLKQNLSGLQLSETSMLSVIYYRDGTLSSVIWLN